MLTGYCLFEEGFTRILDYPNVTQWGTPLKILRAYSEHCQTCRVEFLAKIVNGF